VRISVIISKFKPPHFYVLGELPEHSKDVRGARMQSWHKHGAISDGSIRKAWDAAAEVAGWPAELN
jgi:hypothetical protein